jgi:septum formation protein
MSKPLVLASTSRYRRALIERLGLEVTACAPKCDELVTAGTTPDDLVRLLARRKAESVASDHPKALIIGSDQVAELDGEVLGKPGTPERAVEQLAALSGREHRLLTGLCVHDPDTGRSEVGLTVHRMQMWPLDRALLARYVELDRPIDCAGSYRVEAHGVALFQAMSGDDFTAIEGLPICLLAALLLRFDMTLLDQVTSTARRDGGGP